MKVKVQTEKRDVRGTIALQVPSANYLSRVKRPPVLQGLLEMVIN